MELFEALQLKDREMIAFVGGGGKTSLMHKLAFECTRRGKSVLVTTSTKMFISQLEGCGRLVLEQNVDNLLRELESSLNDCPVTAAASAVAAENDNKAVGLSRETLDYIFRTDIFDFILVEADGSRGLPMKAPREGEPILPSTVTHVLAVTGIDVLNCPLEEKYVQRCHLGAEISGQQIGTPVTGETIRHIIRHYAQLVGQVSSTVKYIPVINKADSAYSLAEARKAAQLLLADFNMVLITAALSPDPVREVVI